MLKSRTAFQAHFSFFFKNYLRSHRYIREFILIIIFHIFFWGFLYGTGTEDPVWTVFGVLGLLLNMVTVPSVFFLEKGNSGYFTIAKPHGRLYFFFAKAALIITIDLFWVFIFTIIYGIRFLDIHYFLLLPVRILFMILLITLSTFILSLAYTYQPRISWLLIILMVFGGILNKAALFPIHSVASLYKMAAFLLPPFLEIIFAATLLSFPLWRLIFIGIAIIQIILYLYLNYFIIRRKDFI